MSSMSNDIARATSTVGAVVGGKKPAKIVPLRGRR
jgi:hypothetical protein